MRAGQGPPTGFRYPPLAGRARRGCATFVHEAQRDAGQGGLVGEDLQEPADLPLPQPQVVPPPRLNVKHPTRVPDAQLTDTPFDRPRHDRTGGFVLGLTDPAPMPALHHTGAASVLAPPPRTPLTRLRRPASHRPAAGFRVSQVHAVLRADRPPRHQQPRTVRARHRIRVDNPQVHPSDPGRIRSSAGRIGRDRNLGTHVQEQPTTLAQQRDRTDLLERVRHLPRQPHPQRRRALARRDPDLPPVQGERAVIPTHRHQPPPPTREPRRHVTVLTSLRCREPRVGEPTQHRPGPRRIQLGERARARRRQLPTQLLKAGQRRVPATTPPRVHLQHTRPHITSRTQQPKTPPPLPWRHPQRHPRGAIHHPRRGRIPTTRHNQTQHHRYDKTPGRQPGKRKWTPH